MTEQLQKWGDAQQYNAEPHPAYAGPEKGVLPQVHLQWMTPDPLGAMAMATGMYEGKVFRHISEVTDEDRRRSLKNMQETHLTAGLEVIRFQFLFDGVDRAFTHQLVRQRTAVYFQESLRFAVPGELKEATTLPPSLQGTVPSPEGLQKAEMGSQADRWRYVWENAQDEIDQAYHYLVETGMPAEEARGLLPTAVATRIVYNTDLRNLIGHAGNRLCTQAQFHWRLVFAGIVDAIRNYTFDFSWLGNLEDPTTLDCEAFPDVVQQHWEEKFRWQFEAIADSSFFRPVCYQIGHCPFKADFDRACTIRERVDIFASRGIPSSEWQEDVIRSGVRSNKIRDEEWLLNPAAARVTR